MKTRPDFKKQFSNLKNQFKDASHHCYAWRIHPQKVQSFMHNNGEPGGTAGLPILNQLKSYEVVNAGLVVIRYYGGTNLGKSGLIQAYGKAAELCLQKAHLHSLNLIQKVRITYPYSAQNAIKKLKHQFKLKELDASYGKKVSLLLACPLNSTEPFKKQLDAYQHLNLEVKFMAKDYR